MREYTPYTYVIGWSIFNVFYYGVRHSKITNCLYESGCHPGDLLKTYFTSSKRVHKMIAIHGLPDICSIRRTFTDKHSAMKWENTAIRRLNAISSPKWLNVANGKPTNVVFTDEVRRKMSNTRKGKGCYRDTQGNVLLLTADDPRVVSGDVISVLKGKVVSDNFRHKCSERQQGDKNTRFRKSHTDEAKLRIGQASKQRAANPEHREKLRSVNALYLKRSNQLKRESILLSIYDNTGKMVWTGNRQDYLDTDMFDNRLRRLFDISYRTNGTPIKMTNPNNLRKFIKDGYGQYLGWSCVRVTAS